MEEVKKSYKGLILPFIMVSIGLFTPFAFNYVKVLAGFYQYTYSVFAMKVWKGLS